ncbi:MAG TPA: hypothetical protein VMY43_05400 [Methanothrix sp.]|nr:hypothetical protein [Methanothrix sp.]
MQASAVIEQLWGFAGKSAVNRRMKIYERGGKAAATRREKIPGESMRQATTEILPTTQKRAAGKVIPKTEHIY